MRHLHISLVGGQREPIYTVIRDIMPNEIWLICSKKTKRDAKHLTTLFSEEGFTTIKTFEVEETDVTKITKDFTSIKSRIGNDIDKVTVNITGGLKPWTLICYRLFSDLNNVALLYRNQDNSLWDFKANTIYPFEHKELTFDNLLKLNNLTAIEQTDFADYTKEDDICVGDIRELRNFNYNAFNIMTSDLYKHGHLTRTEYKSCSLEWNKDSKSFTMFMESRGRTMSKELKSPNVRSLLLNTGWFEYEVASLLSKWEEAEYVLTNIRFAINANDEEHRETNEVDIIVKAHGKFLFVECKTQVTNPTDIDKFNEVGKAFGGLASKRIFITDVEPRNNAKDKFQHKKMRNFVFSNITKSEGAISQFYSELNAYMKGINEK